MVAHCVQCFTHLLEHVRLSNIYLKSVVLNIGPGGQNLPAKASNPTAGTTLIARIFDFLTLNCIYNFSMTFFAD